LTTIAGHASTYKFSGFVLQQLKVYVRLYSWRVKMLEMYVIEKKRSGKTKYTTQKKH